VAVKVYVQVLKEEFASAWILNTYMAILKDIPKSLWLAA
jgi:hypothetical protein